MDDLDDILKKAQKPQQATPLSDLVDEIAERTELQAQRVKAKALASQQSSSGDVPDDKKSAEASGASRRPPMDRYIQAIYLTLCVISVVELYSASSREVAAGHVFAPLVRHVVQILIGMAICFGVGRYPFRWIARCTSIIALLSALAMAYVLVAGDIINGARRGLTIGGILIVPAELLKLSAVLVIARLTARYQEKGGGVKNQGVIWCAVIVICFGGLLFTQGLTNTLLLMCISLSMMLIGGIQLKKFAVVCLLYGIVAGGAFAYKTHSDSDPTEQAEGSVHRGKTWANRLNRWDGDSVPKYMQPITAENRQEMYAYMAQANGGLLGVFPGNSRETARLPLAFSDYIYSIVVEDLGFVGGVVLLVIYLSLLARAGIIASRCDRVFPALLIIGMAVMICFQALFHMAIVTGVFPVSGQPLPMISKGGMSIFVTSFAFGVMLSVSRYGYQRGSGKRKSEETELPESIDAANPLQVKKK